MTLVNTTAGTDKAYKIYAKSGTGSDNIVYKEIEVANDVKFIQYVSGDEANREENGKYYTTDGTLVAATADELNFTPELQWAITTDKYGQTTIKNRADGKALTDWNGVKLYNGSSLKADDAVYITLYGGTDTLKLTSVPTAYKMDSTLGYFAYDKKFNDVKKYHLTYFNALDTTLNIGLDKDSTLVVDTKDGGVWFKLNKKDDNKSYGVGTVYAADGKTVVAKGLYKTSYTLKAMVDGEEFPVVEKDGKYSIAYDGTAASFNLKETENHGGNAWYVLTDGTSKASVNNNTLELYKESASSENRTSMFSLTEEPAPMYRRLGATIEDGIAKNDTAYVEFFMSKEPTRFLYENTQNRVAENGTKVASDSLNYLGVLNKSDLTRNTAIFVDTAYVRNDTVKPLYMLAVRAEFTPAVVQDTCKLHGKDCEHSKLGKAAYITADYLVALGADSIADNKSAKYEGAARLAFVPATHVGDSIIFANSAYTGTKNAGKDSLTVATAKNAVFAFELVDSDDEAADFYIVSDNGSYVKIHNGVPVLASKTEAAVFNVAKTDVKPTANEEIAAEGVKVIAGEGFVTVKGAAGKKVVVANVLGQTVANTVASSDEAQIAAPAGVVIVAVEGEAAVKAIVK